MTAIQREVRQSVYALLDRLEMFRNADPAAAIDEAAIDFNLILSTARQAFPGSETIKVLRELADDAPLITFVSRLATLKGAIDAELYPC